MRRTLLPLLGLLLLAGGCAGPVSPRAQWVMAGDSYAATADIVKAAAGQGKISPNAAKELLLLENAAYAALVEWDQALIAGASTAEVQHRMLVILNEYIDRRLALEKQRLQPTTRRSP